MVSLQYYVFYYVLNWCKFRASQAGGPVFGPPSRTLEGGSYRLRASRRRQSASLSDIKPERLHFGPPTTAANRNVVFFLLFLTVASISCFALAYYVFTTRWDIQPGSVRIQSTNASWQATASLSASDIKYLAYLPHSGFHNQRIAFENALVLAYTLNRTLIVPPIHLGNRPMHYAQYDLLLQVHESASKRSLAHCAKLPTYLWQPSECLDYSSTTTLPWEWLFNLTAIRLRQPLLICAEMTQSWFSRYLPLPEDETIILREDSPYHFRFLDSITDSAPSSERYGEDIYIPALNQVTRRLLRTGSLFGTARVRLRNRGNKDHRDLIRKALIPNHPSILRASEAICNRLGDNYLAAHVRAGDGSFTHKAEGTVALVWKRLVLEVLAIPAEPACKLLESIDPSSTIPCEPQSTGGETLKIKQGRKPSFSCRGVLHPSGPLETLNTPLYLATDIPDPHKDPLLRILRLTFPCMFILADFTQALAPLEDLVSPYDAVRLYSFLLPFVDGLVAGRAAHVVGTEGSTYSQYVERRLWNHFHAAD